MQRILKLTGMMLLLLGSSYFIFAPIENVEAETTPFISVDSITNQPMSSSDKLHVEGTIKDADNGDQLTIKYRIDGLDSHQNIAEVIADGTEQSFSHDIVFDDTIPEGVHTIRVWVEDNSGGKSPEQVRTFTVDKTSPTPPTINVTTETTPIVFSVQGSTDNLTQLKYLYSLDNESTWTGSDFGNGSTALSGTITDTQTTITILAKAIDQAGNESTITSHELNVDNKSDIIGIDSENWDILQNAIILDDGTLQLTDAASDQVGTVWLKRNLRPPYTVDFTFMFTDIGDPSGGFYDEGADGIVFMFNKEKNTTPDSGGVIGFEKGNGYGVEFDSYYNDDWDTDMPRPSDLKWGEIALFQNDANHKAPRAKLLEQTHQHNLEDGQWHTVRIEVGTDIVIVYMDGELKIIHHAPLDESFTGVGFAASTGWYFQRHLLRDVVIRPGPFVVPSFSVSFSVDGGSSVDEITANYDTKISEPIAPIKTGYTLAGWYKDSGLTKEWNFTTDTVTADTTLYAKWVVSEYSVDFEVGGGSAVTSQTVAHGNTASEPSEVPTKANHTFAGWYTSNTYETAFDFGTPITSNTTIYAKWEPVGYTVTYEGNGSTGGSVPTDNHNYLKGTSVTVLGNNGNLVKAGYTFEGWNTAADGSGMNFAADEIFTIGTENVTLFAQWMPARSGGGGGSSKSKRTPSQPKSELIKVPIETGEIGSGSTGIETTITRTTDQSGKVKDEVALTLNQARKFAQASIQSGQNTARIVVPDDQDVVSEINVNIPKDVVTELGDTNINLELFTKNVRIIIPQQSMDNFEDDLTLSVIPIKDESRRNEVENRARMEQVVKEIAKDDNINVIARPIMIETNMQSRAVTLVLPLHDVQIPTDEKEREEFLSNLGIFIEHSDGERHLVKGNLVEYKSGQLGLEFGVNKFSTFTILHLEGWEEQVSNNSHHAYIKGFGDGTFKPSNTVTRAEIATMIARNLGYQDSQQSSYAPFPDVKATHWAAGAIEFVKQHGLIKGNNSGNFNPNSAITRAEMAAIVVRYKKLSLPSKELSEKAFPDIAEHWAMQDIAANKQAGIISGYQDGTFRPNGNLNRAEAVKVINRMFDRGPLYKVTIPTFKDVPGSHWALHEIEEAARDHFFTPRLEGGENIVK